MFYFNTKLKYTVTVITVVLLIAGYFLFYWVPSIESTGEWGNTLSNTDNGGYFTGDVEWLYYRNNGDGGKLYKIKYDGSEDTKLTDQGVDYISIIGKWIFYRRNNRDSYYYTSIKKSKLRDIEVRMQRLRNAGKFNRVISKRSLSRFLVKDKVFFQGMQGLGGGIFEMDLNGKNRNLILTIDEIKNGYNFDNDYMYYVSRYGEGGMYKKSLHNEDEKIKIVDIDHEGEQLIPHREWIYHTGGLSDRYIYRTHKTRGGIDKIVNEDITTYNVWGDYIFYSVRESVTDTGESIGKLYRVNLDGSGKTELLNKHLSKIHVLDGWIYYDAFDKETREYSIERIKIDGSIREIIHSKILPN